MQKHEIYASRDLNINGKSIKAGSVIGTIETDLPLDRFVASMQNGAATLTKPTQPKAKNPAETKTSAPIVDPTKVG